MRGKVACPECGTREGSVIDTRGRGDGTVRRRLECGNGHRFSTYECAVEFVQSSGGKVLPPVPTQSSRRDLVLLRRAALLLVRMIERRLAQWAP